MATPKAGLKTMPTGILKNEAVFNEDIVMIEALTYRGMISRSVLDPSGISPTPSNGDTYFVPEGSPNALGDWSGQGGKIAVYFDGWRFLPPDEGLTIWIADEQQRMQYRNGVWEDINDIPAQNLGQLDDVDILGSPSPEDGDALTFNSNTGKWEARAGGGGGGTAPTRSVVTLTGASVDLSIPAGVTAISFISSQIVVSASGVSVSVELRHTGGATNRPVSGRSRELGTGPSIAFADLSAGTAFCATGATASNTTRYLAGRVISPRDSSKRTICSGVGRTNTRELFRWTRADAIGDDDTLRFTVSSGSFSSGTVDVEFFYN